MVSRANLSGRAITSGVLSRVMKPPIARKIKPTLSGDSGTVPQNVPGTAQRLGSRTRGVGGMVAEAAKLAQSGKQPANQPRARGVGGMVAKAAKKSRANPQPATGLGGMVAAAAKRSQAAAAGTAEPANPPRAKGLGGMVSDAVRRTQAAKIEAPVEPSLGGTTTEKPTRNLPRRSAASRSGRIRSEFE